jgi:hypothetical protein
VRRRQKALAEDSIEIEDLVREKFAAQYEKLVGKTS